MLLSAREGHRHWWDGLLGLQVAAHWLSIISKPRSIPSGGKGRPGSVRLLQTDAFIASPLSHYSLGTSPDASKAVQMPLGACHSSGCNGCSLRIRLSCEESGIMYLTAV